MLFCAVICFVIAFFISGKESRNFSSVSGKFEKVLYANEARAKEELKTLAGKIRILSYKKIFSDKPGYYENLFQRAGLDFLIFENDTLRFWTDNTVAVDDNLSQNNFSGNIVKLPKGWFEVLHLSAGKKNIFALILLKREYAYENKYLVNEFLDEYHLNAEVQIRVDSTKTGRKFTGKGDIAEGDVRSSDGQYLFTLVFPSASDVNLFTFFIIIILNLLGFIFLVWFLQCECGLLSDKIGKIWSFILFIVAIAILRYISITLNFPKTFYEIKLFSPELFGDASSVWLSSLGDLLINAILLFYLIFYCYRNIRIEQIEIDFQKNAKNKFLFSIFLCVILLVLFFSSRVINYLFAGIISNSNIPFTLNDIFSQNIYTYLSLGIVGLFFISYFLFLDKVASALFKLNAEKNYLVVIIGTSIILFIAGSYLLGTTDIVLVLWPLFLFLPVIWIKRKQSGYPFSVIVILLFIIAFFSAHLVIKFAERKEHESRKIFAQKLSAEQDPLAEHLFAEIRFPISTDTALINLLFHSHKKNYFSKPSVKTNAFAKKLLEKYFSGYWEKYDIRVSVFDTLCFPLVQGSAPDRDNLDYFENIIASQATPTESSSFFYLPKSNGRISYLAHIPFVQSKGLSYRIGDLFMEFDSHVIPDEIGFPELLLDRKFGIVQKLADYSYAKYKNGKLIMYHGKFPYSLTAKDFLPDSLSVNEYPFSSFKEADNYQHLLYMPSADSLVIISKNSEGNVIIVTTFSYLFAFFSLLLLLLILFRILIFEKRFRMDSFRSRIQFVLVSIVLVSLLFFGGGTIYYIIQQYQVKNIEAIHEKTRSALIDIEGMLGSNDALTSSQKEYAAYLLKKFSAVFFTDINLYSKEGDLLASSVSRIFDEGILSRKMCPEAYCEMAINNKSEFINYETLGKLSYLSAYLPFKNAKGDVLGFLNLPYFEKENELEQEISAILAAIINIYVLLFAISVTVAIIISDYVTKPMKLIREKLGKIKFGKLSEPIEWRSQDEIGSLVNEYNRMINELHRSAELLAKSERETAWREMAKQVAHEIKNPLTPMKLSIQHLQRTWKNKDDDMD
ncbi:MAG: hypothetical protein ACHQHP_03265, partial [Bacteroidia bacterium]